MLIESVSTYVGSAPNVHLCPLRKLIQVEHEVSVGHGAGHNDHQAGQVQHEANLDHVNGPQSRGPVS